MDFSIIDWTKIDREKAELIWRDAKDHKREIWESLNVLNDKAFRLLALTLPLLSVLLGSLISQWKVLENPVQVLGIVAISSFLIATTAFIFSLWPRGVEHISPEPNAYFQAKFYSLEYLSILHGSIRKFCDDIVHNQRIRKVRSFWLQLGLLSLAFTPLLVIIASFFVGMR